jgi:hypothetical protein
MTDWLGFLVAALLVSLIPGANQLLGLSNAARYGTARAMAGVGGRLAAFVVLIGPVVAGLGAAPGGRRIRASVPSALRRTPSPHRRSREPQPRLAGLTALVWTSSTLPQVAPEILSAVTRARQLEQGSWGAGAAAEAIARSTTATIVTNVVIAAAVLSRQ